MKTVSPTCHRGVVNGACGFVGRPHPSHSFIAPHPTVYKIALSGTLEIFFYRWNYSGWKGFNVCKMKGFIVHPIVWEHLCGVWSSHRFPKFPMEYPFEALGCSHFFVVLYNHCPNHPASPMAKSNKKATKLGHVRAQPLSLQCAPTTTSKGEAIGATKMTQITCRIQMTWKTIQYYLTSKLSSVPNSSFYGLLWLRTCDVVNGSHKLGPM